MLLERIKVVCQFRSPLSEDDTRSQLELPVTVKIRQRLVPEFNPNDFSFVFHFSPQLDGSLEVYPKVGFNTQAKSHTEVELDDLTDDIRDILVQELDSLGTTDRKFKVARRSRPDDDDFPASN